MIVPKIIIKINPSLPSTIISTMSKERYDRMSWGAEKMTAMHKVECGRLKAIIMPYKTVENFPRIFAGDKNNPNQRDNAANGREIEHSKRFSESVPSKSCNHNVSRCTNQGHHATEDRGKRQRHQR